MSAGRFGRRELPPPPTDVLDQLIELATERGDLDELRRLAGNGSTDAADQLIERLGRHLDRLGAAHDHAAVAAANIDGSSVEALVVKIVRDGQRASNCPRMRPFRTGSSGTDSRRCSCRVSDRSCSRPWH